MNARGLTGRMLACWMCIAPFANAQTQASPAREPPRKVVLDVQGPNAALLRKTLSRALTRSGFEVVFTRAGALKKKLSPKGVARVIRKRGAVALLVANVDKRAGRQVALRVYAKGHFSKPAETRWNADGTRGLRKIPEKRLVRLAAFISTLRPVVRTTKLPSLQLPVPVPVGQPGQPGTPPRETLPPSEVASAPANVGATSPSEEQGDEETSDAPELEVSLDEPETEEDVGPSPLEVSVGVRGFSRRLYVADLPSQPFPRYRLGLGPAVVAELDWFPGAHFSQGWVAHLGLTFGIETSFALRSTVVDTVYPTDALAFHVGAKGRIPIGPLQILPSVMFATRSFSFLPSLDRFQPAPVPDVAYRGPRVALDVHWTMNDHFALRLGGAYQAIPQAGELGSAAFFPRLNGQMLDAQLGLFVRLIPGWWLRGGVNFSHIFLRTNAEATDRFSGESGLDQSWGASLALVFKLS